MELILSPYEGIGNLKLGMVKNEISNILSITPETFMKVEGVFMDDFKLMHVDYNDQRKSIAFEIFPEIEVKFKEISLTNNTIENLTKVFGRYDTDIEIDVYGFRSYKYGFSIYGDEEVVESLLVFEKGYYDNCINKFEKTQSYIHNEIKPNYYKEDLDFNYDISSVIEIRDNDGNFKIDFILDKN